MKTATQSAAVWKPFTQMKTAEPPLMVRSASGLYLELEDGRRIMDCISSWWVNLHGHSHPAIAQAVYEQALKLEHVIFAGFTHEPAENYAAELLTHLPPDLNKVFYSDNGSTAVEVALKMAFQYWRNKSVSSRSRFIAFDGGYHGDTVGAMSIGRGSGFWKTFNDIMCPVDVVPFPATFEADKDVEQKEHDSITALKQLLEAGPENYAAICIEPLVQGAGGMNMCRPQFLQELVRTARQYGVLLIYDEVMTGFGRTGDWFACTKSDTTPDIICLSKGITGGALPLSVTVTGQDVYDAFLSDDAQKMFVHGHSYTANPIACAAALASLKLLKENYPRLKQIEACHRRCSQKLAQYPRLIKMRICGTIAAVDVTTSDGNNYFDEVGLKLRKEFLDRGYLIRPLGNTIYLMPPYCIEKDELESAYQTILETVETID